MDCARRAVLEFLGGALIVNACRSDGAAQTFPVRPLTMIVPAPAGGPLDVIGRVLSEPMRGSLGQPIIIENVSGADGSIGTGRAARAKPDGYTIEVGPPRAAKFLQMSTSWLAKARMRGDGPPYVKIGRSVRYSERALVAWMRLRQRRSTGEG
jgi:tripartite-type tricarboxylate transporter receptor subunit TctC